MERSLIRTRATYGSATQTFRVFASSRLTIQDGKDLLPRLKKIFLKPFKIILSRFGSLIESAIFLSLGVRKQECKLIEGTTSRHRYHGGMDMKATWKLFEIALLNSRRIKPRSRLSDPTRRSPKKEALP